MFVPWRPPWMSANKPAPTGTGRPKGGGAGPWDQPARSCLARTKPEPRRGAVTCGVRAGPGSRPIRVANKT
jgi:hypothetical protein